MQKERAKFQGCAPVCEDSEDSLGVDPPSSCFAFISLSGLSVCLYLPQRYLTCGQHSSEWKVEGWALQPALFPELCDLGTNEFNPVSPAL